MATFDVTNHPLLSDGVLALAASALAAHIRIAEEALGLAGAELGASDTEAAKDAVALQVNYQVDVLPDRDWGTITREDPFYYSDKDTYANPVALRMAGRLVGTGRTRPAAAVRPHPRTPVVTSVTAVADRDAEMTVKHRPFEFDIT